MDERKSAKRAQNARGLRPAGFEGTRACLAVFCPGAPGRDLARSRNRRMKRGAYVQNLLGGRGQLVPLCSPPGAPVGAPGLPADRLQLRSGARAQGDPPPAAGRGLYGGRAAGPVRPGADPLRARAAARDRVRDRQRRAQVRIRAAGPAASGLRLLPEARAGGALPVPPATAVPDPVPRAARPPRARARRRGKRKTCTSTT